MSAPTPTPTLARQVTSVSIPMKFSGILKEWGLPLVLTTGTDTDIADAQQQKQQPPKNTPRQEKEEEKEEDAVKSILVDQLDSVSSGSGSGLFAQLGRKHGTDKVTHHGYHRFYPRFIEHYRGVAGAAMLEIGIDQSRSLNTWLEYFPQAFIYGIDISTPAVVAGNRYRILQVDQGNEQQLQHMLRTEVMHPLFLVVDDGSHVPDHQIRSFDLLFGSDSLVPGGTYVIEDVETSYWTKTPAPIALTPAAAGGEDPNLVNRFTQHAMHYGYGHKDSAVEVFKLLADQVNNAFLKPENQALLSEALINKISAHTRSLVSSVTFAHNCIFILKKTREEMADSSSAASYIYKEYL
jgi:hypothetical protein